MSPAPAVPKATVARVAVMEALDRNGGSVRSGNGVVGRLIGMNVQLGNVTNLTTVLRTMSTEALIDIEEVGTPGTVHRKIIAATIIEIPPNFNKPIERLRFIKGIHVDHPERSEAVATVTAIRPPDDEAELQPNPSNFVVDELQRILADRDAEIAQLKSDLAEARLTIRALSHGIDAMERRRTPQEG